MVFELEPFRMLFPRTLCKVAILSVNVLWFLIYFCYICPLPLHSTRLTAGNVQHSSNTREANPLGHME
jgi:hypothetical protein